MFALFYVQPQIISDIIFRDGDTGERDAVALLKLADDVSSEHLTAFTEIKTTTLSQVISLSLSLSLSLSPERVKKT